MKKRKFNTLLNIAVLCMCVTAIVFGVYSAKNASLNISGTIGFKAHNTDIALSGSILACESSESTERTKKDFTIANIGGTQTEYSLDLNKQFTGDSSGKLYFSDLFDDGKIIIITLTLTNNSAFNANAIVNMPTFNAGAYTQEVKLGEDVITDQTKKTMEKDANLTITITLTLINEDTNIDSATISGELLSFSPVVVKTAKLGYADDSNGNKIYCDIKFEEGMTWREWVESDYWRQTPELVYVKINENNGDFSDDELGIYAYTSYDESTQSGLGGTISNALTGDLISENGSYSIEF